MNNELQVRRHEIKYYINRADYEYSRELLKQLMELDGHQKKDRGYFIRSLYFDDVEDNSVEEKLAGVEKRDKYRLRIYDFKQDWVKLERKRKEGNFVAKSTVVITKQEAERMIGGDYDFLRKYQTKAARSILFDLKRKIFRPVVIVDYVRDAYKLDYNDIRITFDQYLRCNDQDLDLFRSDLPTWPLQRDETVILEIKFNHCLPSWFPTMFKLDSATAMAISKYCQSRIGVREYYFD